MSDRTYKITVCGKVVVKGLTDNERLCTMIALRKAGHRTARAWMEVPQESVSATYYDKDGKPSLKVRFL